MSVGVALGSASRLCVECGDCGRGRWIAPSQLVGRAGLTLHTSLSEVAGRLTCSACSGDGLPGKNVTVQAFFVQDTDRIRAEAAVLKTQSVLSVGSRARGS